MSAAHLTAAVNILPLFSYTNYILFYIQGQWRSQGNPPNTPQKCGDADSQFHLDVSFGRVDGFKGLVFLTQLACLAACNLWEPEELHHKSERDAHLALLRGWCLEEGRTAPKVNAMAGNVLRLGPCGTGGSQVIKDKTSAHSETM
ncbi:uncharacterized protein LOC121836651 [Ixodes scapularis]|uniref:uncharacterized protein LOC121836651 n=1 Tax=Ixodes scapularis TaxID=6945 RepID=UPI001C380B2C|nr:uncharacterized protein LOC121836651 [Ixodes scapularis]